MKLTQKGLAKIALNSGQELDTWKALKLKDISDIVDYEVNSKLLDEAWSTA